MKNQALFSSKDKSKKLKCRLFGALRVNPFKDYKPALGTYANSADPVQTLHNAASDQGLLCLFRSAGIFENETSTRDQKKLEMNSSK